MSTAVRKLVLLAMVSALFLTETGASRPQRPFIAASYSRAQKLVLVSGRHMNVFCSGSGSPTVVLDAGLGDGTLSWRYVQNPIARYTRVCSYDRAGMGFSEAASSTRDAGAVVSDLHALLGKASITPPYVLVAHSIAALYSRLYTDRYPADVVGLVLIDPTTEFDDGPVKTMMSASAFAKGRREQRDSLKKCSFNASTCSRLNITLLKQKLKAGGCPKADPEDCVANDKFYSNEVVHRTYWKNQLSELLSISSSFKQVHTEQHPYGTLPLTVLSAGNPDTDPGPLSPAQQHIIHVANIRFHDRIAALSSRGASFVIAGSGHYIQYDRPTAVVSAVDEIVTQARYNGRLLPENK